MAEHKRMRADTYNMLWAAGALIFVAALSIIIYFIASCVQETPADTGEDLPAGVPPSATVTYRLSGVRRGPLLFASADTPLRQEDVEAAGATVVPARTFSDKEEPYETAHSGISLQPEALAALTAMARDMPSTPGVALSLDAGYLSWEAAGEEAGTSPYHTGYALRLSLSLNGETSLSFGEAITHPTAAAPAAWVGANLTYYGFVRPNSASPEELLYVGLPHATVMTAEGLAPDAYLAWVRTYAQSTPYVWQAGGDTQHLFYLPANYGVANVTVPEDATLYAVGDGGDGFVVAVRYHTP